MTAITITDLNNAKLDVDHITAVATSLNETVTDRLGGVKLTMAGASNRMQVQVDATEASAELAVAQMQINLADVAATVNRGAWAPTTLFNAKDLASNAGTWYMCVVPHTSSAVFVTDAASKWVVHQITNTLNEIDYLLYPVNFLAVGDGATDDTARFAAIEALHTGKNVDLGGKTYLVTAEPSKNNYTNGKFKIGVATSQARAAYNQKPPHFHAYGGQLRKLREALNNPFEGTTGICLIGDSITWGRTLPENAAYDPRTGALSDPRDSFTSASWANELKRYIGEVYFEAATPTLTNWAGSASGQAIATYQRNVDLFTMGEGFTSSVVSGSPNTSRVATANALLGYRHNILVATGESYAVDFNFTGNSFNVYYTCQATVLANASYELIVDGVSIGNFNAQAGTPNTNKNIFTHTFGYVRNKTVRLRVFWNAGGSASQYMQIEGVRIPKKVVITNQGIIGTTSRVVAASLLPSALSNHDNFAFVMLGTNDRAKTASPALADAPNDVLSFRANLKSVKSQVAALSDVIFMCANPATENPSIYCLTQQIVRGAIDKVAKENGHDFIDNYSIFNGTSLAVVTADNLHPNAFGMRMIAQNIIGALEQA